MTRSWSLSHPLRVSPAFARKVGVCLNVKITENAMFRFEGRQFYSSDAVYFDADDQLAHHSALVIANLTAWF
jgi:hypothetical protein